MGRRGERGFEVVYAGDEPSMLRIDKKVRQSWLLPESTGFGRPSYCAGGRYVSDLDLVMIAIRYLKTAANLNGCS